MPIHWTIDSGDQLMTAVAEGWVIKDEAIAYAAAHGVMVTFFPVDSTRANLDFLKTIYRSRKAQQLILRRDEYVPKT